MGWVRPTGHSNNDRFVSPQHAYDGETWSNSSVRQVPSDPYASCQFDRAVTWCNSVGFLANQDFYSSAYVYLDVYYDSSWHTVLWITALTKGPAKWYTGDLDTAHHVTAARIRVGNGANDAYFFEIEFYEVLSPPSTPTQLLCEAATNPTGVTDTTPEFSAVLNDPEPGDMLAYVEIEVASDESFSNKLWDSGWIDIADVVAGVRCADVTYAGTSIPQAGQTFYWRIRAKDDGGSEGLWSATATFTMAPKQVSVSDAGAGAEAVGWQREVAVVDAGAAEEIASWLRDVGISEDGHVAVERIEAYTHKIIVSDGGVGAEAVSPLNWIRTRSIRVNAPAKDPVKAYPAKDAMIEYDPNAGGE